MIDFTLTETDQAIVDYNRAAALICRKYARYYDENEDEMLDPHSSTDSREHTVLLVDWRSGRRK